MLDAPKPTADASATLLDAGHHLICAGDWSVHGITGLRTRLGKLAWVEGGELVIDFSKVTRLDTAGVWALHRIETNRIKHGQTVRVDGMQAHYEALRRLVESRAPEKILPLKVSGDGPLAVLGRHASHWLEQVRSMLQFIGENTVVLLRALKAPKHLRFRAIFSNIQQAGRRWARHQNLLAEYSRRSRESVDA